MNPLCFDQVTLPRFLHLESGESNLKSFIESGYNHISVNPCAGAMKILNKHGFINKGFPVLRVVDSYIDR